ncbi:hypothetical protein N7449_000575 [Penicillium cf. viridicatum]|uniref:Uncharacterized protein n=1 Tax=Penicillium cf. viridicatum TaxID=2972119 RepID=A0A9W9N5A5_9EURO|nr:hypothetical protein N7449_000575 [Penicillium cf. viridicatum]
MSQKLDPPAPLTGKLLDTFLEDGFGQSLLSAWDWIFQIRRQKIHHTGGDMKFRNYSRNASLGDLDEVFIPP